MENKEMERKVKTAFEHATPDILESVMEDFNSEKGKVIPMTKRSNNWIKRSVAIAAVFALVAVGAVTFGINRVNNAIASTIALDVNPGIEIKVNKKNVVREVVPLNDDGVKIVDDMDFAGSNLEVALHALVGSMVKNGYLSEVTNSILVSVDGKDEAKNAELQKYVAAEIDKILGGNNVSGAVLSQTVETDTEVEKLAKEYGISIGKAQVINKIAKKNTQYKVADLAKLSINDLNLISEGKGQHIEKVTATGTASSKGYIGSEKAKEIVLKKAGVKEADARDLEVDLDMDAGVLVYEVDFDTRSYEYEYEVDAKSGKILMEQKEPTGYQEPQSSTAKPQKEDKVTSSSYISKSKAKSIALDKAGVKSSSATFEKVELDKDDGTVVYEVDFRTSSYEYDYKIHAVSGKVLESDKERIDRDDDDDDNDDDDDDDRLTSNKVQSTSDYISKAKAKSIALNKAGVKESATRDLEVELDSEDGVKVYEISFETSEYEYEYVISAKTGKILEADKERRDD